MSRGPWHFLGIFSHRIDSSAAVQYANPGFRAAQPTLSCYFCHKGVQLLGRFVTLQSNSCGSIMYFMKVYTLHFLLDREHQQRLAKHSDF